MRFNQGWELVSVQNKCSSSAFLIFHYNLLNMHVTFDLYRLEERHLTGSGASNTHV